VGRRANGEGAAFRPHGNGWVTKVWVGDPDGRRRRISLYAPTKTHLRRKVDEARGASEAGQPARTSRARFGDYAQTWIETSLAARDVTPSTRRLYAQVLRSHVIPALAAVPLGELRAGHVESLHARMRRLGRSAALRRTAHQVLRLVCETAARDGLIRANPVLLVPRPADPPRQQACYSLTDAYRLIAAAAEHRVLAQLVPLLLFTGLRVGEALALRWPDVDFEAGRLTAAGTLSLDEAGHGYRSDYLKDRSKRRPSKLVPLLAPAAAALRDARHVQLGERLAAGSAWADLDLVFADELGGLLDDRDLRKPYRALLSGLGLTGSFHALRRTSATVLIASGAPLPVVSEILGHSSGRVTMAHYVMVSESTMRAALESAFGTGR
jgi:integrase